jgi:hypothetical protein
MRHGDVHARFLSRQLFAFETVTISSCQAIGSGASSLKAKSAQKQASGALCLSRVRWILSRSTHPWRSQPLVDLSGGIYLACFPQKLVATNASGHALRLFSQVDRLLR